MNGYVFSIVCLGLAAVLLLLSAHRGSTLTLRLPGNAVSGSFELSRPVRVGFQVFSIVSVVLGVTAFALEALPDRAPDSALAGPTSPASTGPASDDSGPRSTSTETPAGEPSSPPPRTMVEVWGEDCDFAVGHFNSLEVDGPECPRTVDDETSGDVDIEQTADGLELQNFAGTSMAGWEETEPPTAEDCRKLVDRGGSASDPVPFETGDAGKGVCLRTKNGTRYVYLELTEIRPGFDDSRISGRATGWDYTVPGQ